MAWETRGHFWALLVRSVGAALLVGGYFTAKAGGGNAVPSVVRLIGVAAVVVGFVMATLGGRIVATIERRLWTNHCRSRGWRYMQASTGPPAQWNAGFIRRGNRQVAWNVVWGLLNGEEFEAWTLECTIGYGLYGRTATSRVFILRMPTASPGVAITEETAKHKAAQATGAHDIGFESDRFSRAFWVTSPDRRFAYSVIDPRMMEFLLSIGPSTQWAWEGDFLCVSRPGRMTRRNLTELLPLARAFRERVPRHVVAQSMGRATSA